ncbi:MAG: hypothetical protein IJ710_05690 [Prevotella sp.]|nr:hypothetical protein [Prevotella sp.]
MKFYHVIYTSSQRLLNGGNGFGIRTATEGTPSEYLQHVLTCVTQSTRFNSNVEGCKMPTASELIADGSAIRVVPPRYFYLEEAVEGKKLYIVGRNVYLGFTEAFYAKGADGKVSGTAGRTGNYLIDLYLFEERPSRDVFQILYEHPESGKSQFVPQDAAPLVTNSEMADLATGDPAPLPVEEWTLRSDDRRPLDNPEKTVDLLFALIEARLSGKKLVVKYGWEKTHLLIADVIQLMSDSKVGGFTFSTNFTGNGYNVPAEVNFVNEYYSTQYLGSDLFVDLNGAPLSTKESDTYRQIVLDAVSAGDLGAVRRLTDFVLSAAYTDIRSLHSHTVKTLYHYTQMPERFTLDMLHQEEKEDAELLTALNKLITADAAGNRQPFVRLLEQALDAAVAPSLAEQQTAQTAALVGQIEIYQKYLPLVEDIVTPYRVQIEEALMAQPAEAIRILGLATVRKYTHNLAQGLQRPELAPYLLTMEKEQRPTSLKAAIQLIAKYQDQNRSVFQLLAEQFRDLFGGVYDAIVSEVSASSDRQTIAKLLDEQLLAPMSEAKADAAYQRLELLCDVLYDNASVSVHNYRDVLAVLSKAGMVRSKTGDAVKALLFEERSLSGEAVEALRSIWHLDPKQIIAQTKQLVAEGKMDARSQQTMVASALETSGFTLSQAMDVLKENGFTKETDAILSQSRRYRSDYDSYKNKQRIFGFFKKLFSPFSREGKGNDKKPAKKESPKMSKETVRLAQSPRPDARKADAAPKPVQRQEEPRVEYGAPESSATPKILSESELQKVEKYLRNSNMQVSKVVEENANEVSRRIAEARRKGELSKLPKELKRFVDLVPGLLLALLLSLGGSLNAAAASQSGYYSSFGDDKSVPTCYVVDTESLNVRTSPSLYSGKRKTTKRKDNVGFQLSQGDTIFVNTLEQPQEVDGVTWIGFVHNGSYYYTDLTKLRQISNPRTLQDPASRESNADSSGFIGWLQRSAPWILLLLTVLLFAFSFSVNTPDKDSLQGEVRTDTGMRPMFMYSLRPYKFFAGLSLRVLIALACSIALLLAIGSVVWGFLWLIKIVLWIFVIIGWILLVGGIICLFANPIVGIILAAIGGIIVHYEEPIGAFGNSCVATGMAFFDAVNVWQFSLHLIQTYWLTAVAISLAPLVAFLLAAILMSLFALCLRGYEWLTTYRYNVKHPCPWCHEPSEPAEYYDVIGGALPTALPTPLRPGIYGLFHITHPQTNRDMPTLIANGRDRLLRRCPHCGHFISFETGTEKHVGFVGRPESGKTTLLSAITGWLMLVYKDFRFTDGSGRTIEETARFFAQNGHLDLDHLPAKTAQGQRASIQCILPRTSGGLPYHLYLNDIAGEHITDAKLDAEMMRFSKDVTALFFILDPLTMALSEDDISAPLRQWLQAQRPSASAQQQDVVDVFDSLVLLLGKTGRDLAEIDLTFVLPKSDAGYLGGIDTTNPDALRRFVSDDMALPHLIGKTKRFRSVSYYAISVYTPYDKGIDALCNNLYRQLGLE